ncbi:MAG: polyphenol oxidase family protein [Akkermansiaceae bacterium]|nr:polyphenol oxidase family protein [Akkermansiaceae bacterium]NNM30408.1 polyphenol oxidase family protein [Akkermansiaceae bacterium]
MAEAASFLGGMRMIPGVRAGFTGRVEGVEPGFDKGEALGQLEPAHREAVKRLGFEWEQLWRAEQVHGAEVAVVPSGGRERMAGGADGLVTGTPGVLLGIYVADCAAVFLADRRHGALGLVHSGRKGTGLGIVGRALALMGAEFGTDAGEVVAAISPCIRPPLYEVDIAGMIREQLREAGVPDGQVTDCGICTGAEVGRYYSYRVEKGKTGRMLALLGRVEGGADES